jgi:hypothetical protein
LSLSQSSQLDPVAGTVALHQMSPTGAYADEMAGGVADAEKELGKPTPSRPTCASGCEIVGNFGDVAPDASRA